MRAKPNFFNNDLGRDLIFVAKFRVGRSSFRHFPSSTPANKSQAKFSPNYQTIELFLYVIGSFAKHRRLRDGSTSHKPAEYFPSLRSFFLRNCRPEKAAAHRKPALVDRKNDMNFHSATSAKTSGARQEKKIGPVSHWVAQATAGMRLRVQIGQMRTNRESVSEWSFRLRSFRKPQSRTDRPPQACFAVSECTLIRRRPSTRLQPCERDG